MRRSTARYTSTPTPRCGRTSQQLEAQPHHIFTKCTADTIFGFTGGHMRLTRTSLAMLSVLAALARPTIAEDRNLAVQKTLYTKIRNQVTLGEDQPGSLFVMLNPGITLDKAWDLTKVADQQKFTRLLLSIA